MVVNAFLPPQPLFNKFVLDRMDGSGVCLGRFIKYFFGWSYRVFVVVLIVCIWHAHENHITIDDCVSKLVLSLL